MRGEKHTSPSTGLGVDGVQVPCRIAWPAKKVKRESHKANGCIITRHMLSLSMCRWDPHKIHPRYACDSWYLMCIKSATGVQIAEKRNQVAGLTTWSRIRRMDRASKTTANNQLVWGGAPRSSSPSSSSSSSLVLLDIFIQGSLAWCCYSRPICFSGVGWWRHWLEVRPDGPLEKLHVLRPEDVGIEMKQKQAIFKRIISSSRYKTQPEYGINYLFFHHNPRKLLCHAIPDLEPRQKHVPLETWIILCYHFQFPSISTSRSPMRWGLANLRSHFPGVWHGRGSLIYL